MGRRIFLALLMGVALSCARASAQEGAPKPPDRVTLEELKAMLADKKPVLILDVRHEIDRKIKGAAHIPLDHLESRLSELPREGEIVTYCSWPSEGTSARAARTLQEKGFKARALIGGYQAWINAGGETEPAGADEDADAVTQHDAVPSAVEGGPTASDASAQAGETAKPAGSKAKPKQKRAKPRGE